MCTLAFYIPIIRLTYLERVLSISVHPYELPESAKKKLTDQGYFYANFNAGIGWTDRANRYTRYDSRQPDL